MVCRKCPRGCGERSFCGFVDIGGRDLYPYKALLMTVSSVEALPLYHYYPGSRVLKVWVGGYTYICENCPWEPIARSPRSLELRDISVDLVLRRAVRSGASLIIFTGAEPLVNDWIYEACSKISESIPCGFKTSGYISFERLEEASKAGSFLLFELPGAASIRAPMKDILDNAENAGRLKTHLEYVYLEVGGPRSHAMLSITASRLPEDRPLHIYPIQGYTPSERDVERIAGILRDKGFKHYYIHGDPTLRYENTYCPRCGYPVIERIEGRVKRILLRDGKCPKCGYKVEIIGARHKYGGARVPWLVEEEPVW